MTTQHGDNDPLVSPLDGGGVDFGMDDGAGQGASADGSVRNLELCSDDRLLRRALPDLDEAAAVIGEALRLCFTRALRGPVALVAQPSTLLPYEDARALEDRIPGRLLLRSVPGECDLPLLIDTPLVLLHVQREFGGTLDLEPVTRKELTGLERSLLGGLGATLTDAVLRGLGPLGVRLTLRGTAARPAATALWSRQALVVDLQWTVTVGRESGVIHLLLPALLIEALRERFSGERHGARDARWRRELTGQIRQVEIESVVELGKTRMTLNQVLELREGEVLRLDRSLTESLPVVVEGRVKLRGRPGTRGDTVTLTIEDIGETR